MPDEKIQYDVHNYEPVNKYIDEVYGEGASKEQWDTWNRLTKVTEGSYRTLVK